MIRFPQSTQPRPSAQAGSIINKAFDKDNLRYQHASDLRANLQGWKTRYGLGRNAASAIPTPVPGSPSARRLRACAIFGKCARFFLRDCCRSRANLLPLRPTPSSTETRGPGYFRGNNPARCGGRFLFLQSECAPRGSRPAQGRRRALLNDPRSIPEWLDTGLADMLTIWPR